MKTRDNAGSGAGGTPSDSRLEAAMGRARAATGKMHMMLLHSLGWDEKNIPATSLQIIEKLGEGGFAVVEKAWYTPSPGADRRLVAVKRMRPQLAEEPGHYEMFQMEIALARKLRHRNIVGYVGCGGGAAARDAANTFFVQELMQGGTLRRLVMRQMLQNPTAIYSDAAGLDICLQVSRALRYMHMARPMVIHRDLKLDNVLLTTKDPDPATGLYTAKLGDFGLSCAVSAGRLQRTQSGSVLFVPRPNSWDQMAMAPSSSSGSDLKGPRDPGPAARRVTQLPVLQVDQGLGRPCTAGFWNSRIKTHLVQPAAPRTERFDLTSHTGSLMYMAPEVYRKEVYDEKADVYSFGVILYEVLHKYMMLSAVCTTGTEAEIEAYARSVADDYRPPIHDHWPQPVKDLIRACWAPEPSDRPCMNEVVSRLTAIQDLGGLSTKHQAPGGGQCCVVS